MTWQKVTIPIRTIRDFWNYTDFGFQADYAFMEGISNNTGDINLGKFASLMGDEVRSGRLQIEKVATTFRDRLCE